MPAMHDEAPGADRDELLQRRLDPVLGLDGVEAYGQRDIVAGGDGDQFADRDWIGRLRKMHGDAPAPAGPLERGDRGVALEKALGQAIDHAPGGRFAADRETGAVGAGGEGGGHRRSGNQGEQVWLSPYQLPRIRLAAKPRVGRALRPWGLCASVVLLLLTRKHIGYPEVSRQLKGGSKCCIE